MRSAPANVRSQLAALLAVLLLLLVPSAGFAAGDAPQEMVDPVAAMEPEIDATVPTPQENGEVEVTGNAGGAEQVPQATVEQAADQGAMDAVAYDAPSGAGTLPFTGIDGEQLTWLFLVGSLAVAAGVLAFSWAGATRELA